MSAFLPEALRAKPIAGGIEIVSTESGASGDLIISYKLTRKAIDSAHVYVERLALADEKSGESVGLVDIPIRPVPRLMAR